jgi:hypothetical protein
MPMPISGAKWLLWKSGSKGRAEITVLLEDGSKMQSELEMQDGSSKVYRLMMTCAPPGSQAIVEFRPGQVPGVGGTNSRSGMTGTVRLIETWTSASQQELHAIHSQAAQQGTRSQAIRIIQALIPEIQDLEILTEGNSPYLAARYADRAVPVALTGDGVHALIRLCYELAVSDSGLVLLEEPETHQHPAALVQTAAAILAAVRNNVQVVLSTHSLELIDALVAKATDEDIDKLALFRVRLDDGELLSSRLHGKDVVLSRTQIEDDLR